MKYKDGTKVKIVQLGKSSEVDMLKAFGIDIGHVGTVCNNSDFKQFVRVNFGRPSDLLMKDVYWYFFPHQIVEVDEYKIKVGDRVKLKVVSLYNEEKGFTTESTGRVITIDRDTSVLVQIDNFSDGHGMNNDQWWFPPFQLEVIPQQEAECSIGVGNGDGQLFVHGSYEAVKRVQDMIIELECLRQKIDKINEVITQ